ncbi:cell filamentation protein Fic [Curtobacterium sp. MCPF17_003]|uniref:Fic family protein n=1 Tax=Curtobacterium sp. MCPF17_003 TaxID=2175637 RepID=UPI000D89BF7A|nr:Fic family protein [Curtobacterium sp. MCPF17_003]PYY64426.1 cell filamentation protein Fic [Curtobacterium sp. MCPF17_003]
MKAIRRHIFQDVYEWAGQERVGPVGRMTKAGPDVVKYAPGDPNAPKVAYGYYPADAIADAAALQYRRLARKQFLTGLGRDEFVTEYAEAWAELNVVHSFREGNTRTQFVFFSQLAEHAGYRLDTEAFKIGAPLRDEFVWARFYSQATGDSSRLAGVLDRALVSPAAEPVAVPAVGLAERRRRFPELFNGDTAVHDSDELERE